jgi:Tfp pilus assembly protein PilO
MAINYRSKTFQLSEYLQDSKNKSFFTAFTTFAFVIIMALFGIIPAYSSLGSQIKDNELRDEAKQNLEKKLDDLKKLFDEQKQNESLVNYLFQVFPDNPTQENVIELLENLGKKDGIFIKSFGFSENQGDSNILKNLKLSSSVKYQRVNVIAEGTQSGIVNFVKEIETLRRIVNIENLTINRKTGVELTQSQANLDFKLNIQADYFYFEKN